LKAATESQAKYYNAKHMPKNFAIEDKVLLSTKNLQTQRPSQKLDQHWLGPFNIEDKIRKQAYQLKLPTSYSSIHPTFHVLLLEPYRQQSGEEPEEPAPVLVDRQEEWVVESVLDRRMQRGKVQYLVHWEGYTSHEDTWEPKENLENAQDMISDYERTND
jgi:hypothetical protein